MQMDSIQDSTRYVVSTLHHGSILPGKRMEMTRDVYLLSGADVRGGVWCGSLTINGSPVIVQKAVYCKGSFRIQDNDNEQTLGGDVTFGSSVVAGDSIVTGNTRSKVRFRSDIYTGQVNISNAFVYGNIYAKRVIIRDSVVLGGIFCDGPVRIERCMVSTFQARDVVIGPGTYLFMPFAIGTQGISLEAPVCVVTFLTLLDSSDSLDKGDVVFLTNEDILTIKGTVNNISPTNGDEVPYFKCLTLSDRILNTMIMKKHFEFNRRLVETLALGNNLDSDSPNQFNIPEHELESRLWNFLGSSVKQAPSRTSNSIKDLFTRVKQVMPI